MSHTPGPWRIVRHSDQSGGCNILTERHSKAGLPCKTSDFIAAVGVCPNPWQNGLEEARANARLIAAAPDMLAALKGALVSVETIGEFAFLESLSPDARVAINKRLEAIRAAIAKAEDPS